jgi:hypothetical protein
MKSSLIFKETGLQQFKMIYPLILKWIAISIAVKYYLKINLNDSAFLLGFLFFFILDILPTIILHIQYYLKNRNSVLILDTQSKTLNYSNNLETLTYKFNDISKLQYFRNYGKGSGWNSFGMYRYYKIIFNDNNVIFITCLMINNIENTLEVLLALKAENHGKFLNLIS